MAPAELTQQRGIASDTTRELRVAGGLRRAWLGAYCAIWALTLGVNAIVALAGPLKATTRHLLGLRLQPSQTPSPALSHVLSLAVHNLPIAAWPLLLGVVGAHHSRTGRLVADSLLAGCLAVNVLPVGAALGAYGPELFPYVPHLPFEWAALAAGASAWLLERHRTLTVHEGLALLALTSCMLLSAAVLETYAVPHERHAAALDIRSKVNPRTEPPAPSARNMTRPGSRGAPS
jgi:hypothetical protein